MAKNVNRQRKEELIASLNQKRENIAQKTDNLQQAVAPRKSLPAPQRDRTEARAPSAALAAPLQKIAGNAVTRLTAIPLFGKTMRLGNNLSAKWPSNFIRKEAAKPILIGLGASFVIMTLWGRTKRKKARQAEELASMRPVTKPAVGFLLLKTALSVTQPALKQLVKKLVSKGG